MSVELCRGAALGELNALGWEAQNVLVELRGAVGACDGLVASAAASVIGARRACWLCAAALGTPGLAAAAAFTGTAAGSE